MMSKLRLSNSNKSIVLVGHMGSGKSTIGKNLSKKLGIDFFDSDKEIELREKIKITNIFSSNGEKYFRDLEEKINLKLLKYKNIVLALGGGAFENSSVRKVALEKCNCIWLKCSLNLLEQRCNFKKNRPLLENKNIKKELLKLDKIRRKNYSKAHLSINVGGKTKYQVTKELLNQIKLND